MKVKQTSCKKDSHEKSIKTKFKVGKSVKACKTNIEDISTDDSVNQIFNDGLNFVDVADTIDFLDDDFIDLNVICYFCQNAYDSKIKLNQHIIKKHKNDVETCELCRISFIDKSSLDTHKNKHITRKQNVLKCSLCPQAFFNRPKLIYHEYNHGADRIDNGLPLENDNICSVVLPNNTNDFVDFENLFTCDLCSKSFKKLPSLNRHRLLHEKAKVANCKSAETKIIYTDPPQSLESQPVLKFLHCKYCIKLFANNETLERHVALHELNERKKKYVCKYCQKRYMMPAMLFSHFRKSHKFETPFSCLYCDKYFSRRQEFSLHIKHLHQNSGTIKFDSNYSIVYGTTFIPNDDHFQNMTFDIHNSALDSCFHETRFLDVNTDDFIDLDSSNLEEISLDTDCFNTEKNNDFDSMIANMDTNADNDNYVVFNDDILDILESAKSDELLKDNCESVIPLDEVMLPNIIKDSSNYDKINEKDISKEDGEKEGELASCEVCGVTLKKQSLKSHVSLHYNRSSQKYKCHLCSMSFRTKVKLDLHIKDHFQNDKKLCICGVKCDSSESLMKHKEQCLKTFFSFEPNIKTKPLIGNKDYDIDPLNDNNIVIFNAEENSCVILEDSVENRNYIKDSNSIKNICKSLEAASTSSNYITPTPILFRKPIEAPSPKVIIKRITQEEAALKKKIIIKATPMEEKNTFSTAESQTLPKLIISQIPAASCSTDIDSDSERILVNVNPLAHLLPTKDSSTSKKKSAKSQKLDYASIIEKSLTSILHIKRME